MTQYNTLNAKLSNSLLSKLKSGIKDSTELTVNLSSNAIGNSNDETGLSHKLLLTNKQVLRLYKLSQLIHQLIQNYEKITCIK